MCDICAFIFVHYCSSVNRIAYCV